MLVKKTLVEIKIFRDPHAVSGELRSKTNGSSFRSLRLIKVSKEIKCQATVTQT